MKHYFALILSLAVLAIGSGFPASAQETPIPGGQAPAPRSPEGELTAEGREYIEQNFPAPPSSDPAAVSAEQGAPDVAPAQVAGTPYAPPPAVGYFPALPPSRPCVKKDMRSAWKLVQVYENPIGTALAQFNAEPFQYLYFDPDTTIREYKSSQQPLSGMEVKQKMMAQQGTLKQYLVHESGIIYFYQDGVAVDSQACFIVANRQEPFVPGQMLLMPPAPPEGQQAASRVVKVFKRIQLTPPRRAVVRKRPIRR
jgi:hypothetical protein